MALADDLEAKRQTAVYARTVAWLRHTQPDMSDAEMDAAGLAANDAAVYGADAKKDRNGNFLQQGIGSKGRESHNHLAAILKYEGREAHDREVRRICKETPDHARALGLRGNMTARSTFDAAVAVSTKVATNRA